MLRQLRRIDLTSMTTPAALGIAQSVVTKITPRDATALGRWGIALSLTAYWFIEPDFSRWKSDPAAKQE